MNWRFWRWAAVWALLAWWLVENPAQAGQMVHHIGGGLAHAGRSLSVFVSQIGA